MKLADSMKNSNTPASKLYNWNILAEVGCKGNVGDVAGRVFPEEVITERDY